MCTIITQHPESDVLQLVKYLSDISVFDDGSLCWYISPDDEEIWKSCANKVDKSSIIILYHSYSLETPLPDLSDMEKLLDYCRRKHDPEKIKVVISDMEDENLEGQIIDTWKAGRYRDWELLTFTKAEMRCLIEQKINPLSAERRLVNKLRHMYKIVQEATDPARNAIVKDSDSKPDIEEKSEVSFKGNMDKIRKIIQSTRPKNWGPITKPHTVGIFSRSSESDYEWLIKQLKSESFRNIVSTANPHSISNNGMRKFMDAVSGCTFGILYHTKNRGRINIVDVTNSLYDEELKYLSKHLGREKVIVVVDDLEDTSDGEKRRILETQPSIGTLTRDLFLFNANDNKNL